jgi:hypothetical protein
VEVFRTFAFGCKETISIFILPSFVLVIILYDGSSKVWDVNDVF